MIEDFVNNNIRSIIDYGSESYQSKINRSVYIAGAVALFLIFVVFLLWRKK